jgi:hypothetical protein
MIRINLPTASWTDLAVLDWKGGKGNNNNNRKKQPLDTDGRVGVMGFELVRHDVPCVNRPSHFVSSSKKKGQDAHTMHRFFCVVWLLLSPLQSEFVFLMSDTTRVYVRLRDGNLPLLHVNNWTRSCWWRGTDGQTVYTFSTCLKLSDPAVQPPVTVRYAPTPQTRTHLYFSLLSSQQKHQEQLSHPISWLMHFNC